MQWYFEPVLVLCVLCAHGAEVNGGFILLGKRFFQSVFAVLLLGAVIGVPQAAALAAPLVDNTKPYFKGYAHKCIEVPGNSTVNNTVMDIYTCIETAANERWDLSSHDTGYWFQNQNSHKCMTVQNASTANNALILQYTCANQGNEEWGVGTWGTIGGFTYYQIVNVNSGKCLTVQNNGTANGSKLLQYTCNKGYNQAWIALDAQEATA
jgi:hypothetical protein